ncbi:MAG TPA: efflux transporter outer membrane subunit [Myxococcaceae bacterium]|nr:efflux transporter outer membrane subunit [Myxococcaceae bacterium]
MKRALVPAIMAVATTGCLMGPDYQRPVVPTPATYRDAPPTQDAATIADLPWWTVFKDPELQSLLAEAVQNNRDLRAAVARVEQARALARIQKAQILPAVTANAGASYGRGSLTAPSENPVSGAVFTLDAQVSWEIDVWGRIRRGTEAAVAEYLATEQGRRAATVSLVADVAVAYVQLRQLDAQLDVARRTVSNYQRTLQLYSDRLQGGAGNKLPVTTGRAQVNDAQAVARDTERLIVRQENLLSLLLGRPPGPIARSNAPPTLQTGPIPAGLPSTLVERRPDVLAVEQSLVAANARIGVAKADFFPRFSLTALAGFASPDLTKLFDPSKSFVWGAGGSVSWLAPLLQGDALHGQAEAASAQWEEAKNSYEQTVLTAFREVADALDDVQRLDGVLQQREEEVANLTESVGLAVDRFYGGVASYLEVTTTQNLLFPAELNLAAVHAQRTAAFINLYRALGGGWQVPPPAAPAPVEPTAAKPQ